MQKPTSPLGKKSVYLDHYSPDLLFPVSRKDKRRELNIIDSLPFKGFDVWTAYELSWLNTKGKPIVAIGEIIFPCTSPYLIESKSLKLYFNSFNNTMYPSTTAVQATMQRDLSLAANAEVAVKIHPLPTLSRCDIETLSGHCIDDYDIECDHYTVCPQLLTLENEKKSEQEISETLFSNLLRSNCLMTAQPDWGSVQISYTGKKINHENLLKYIVSFRNHTEFGEHCAERIFTDIMHYCAPKKLTVYARYTRRGGIDINPYRSTENCESPENNRLPRQ